MDLIVKALEYTPLSDVGEDEYSLYVSIEKDYNANAKKIVQVFEEHIKPKLKEMLN